MSGIPFPLHPCKSAWRSSSRAAEDGRHSWAQRRSRRRRRYTWPGPQARMKTKCAREEVEDAVRQQARSEGQHEDEEHVEEGP